MARTSSGYSEEELLSAIDSLNKELENEKKKGIELHNAAMQSSSVSPYQNLIEWQLDISKELEFISHMLRGHVIKRDNEGNEYWSEPDDKEQKIFNEKGAQEIEKIIRNYLNKNVLLSNYDEQTINLRVWQFANRLRRFIFLNYEDFGMDTEYKQKQFEMIVMNIVDLIEAAYYRALGGQERESLRTARHVMQSDNGKGLSLSSYPTSSPGGSKLNPVNWFK